MIKCKIFTGTKFEDEGKVRFMHEGVNGKNTIDEGYFDYFDEKEFKLHIQVYASLMGKHIDAYDKDGNIFWSNYLNLEKIEADNADRIALEKQKADEKAKKEAEELEKLQKQYKELSGEEAKKTFGIRGLKQEIAKLTDKPKVESGKNSKED